MALLTASDVAKLAASYNFFRFITPSTGNTTRAVRVPTSGTHVYINRIDGPGMIQLRFGRNAWINVCEGMTITREFNEYFVRDTHEYAANSDVATRVELYSSHGQLIQRPFKSHGSKGPPIAFNGLTATTTTQGLNRIVYAGSNRTIGTFDGGFIIITNTSVGSTLYVGGWLDNVGAPATNGFGIAAGSTIAFDIDGQLGSSLAPSPTTPIDFCFWTLVGTCTFDILLGSGKANTSDPDYRSGAPNAPATTMEGI